MPVDPSMRRQARLRAKALRGEPRVLVGEAVALARRDPFRAFELCRAAPWAVARMTRAEVGEFLPTLIDWCTTDCYGCFISGVAWREGVWSDDDVLALAWSEDRWVRRAALVSTVPLNLKARGATNPEGEARKTLRVCERLVNDRDDMVVKAMSWALRELARKDPAAVKAFVEKHRDRLAARVLREVKNTMTTGLKNPRKRTRAAAKRRRAGGYTLNVPGKPEARPIPAPKRRWTRWLLTRGLVLAAIIMPLRFFSLGESMAMYFPSRRAFATPAAYQDVNIPTPDGLTLHAWFMPARDAAPGERRPAILHLHGNAGNIADHVVFSEFLTDAGFHVMIVDYRGYGRSSPARLLTRRQLMTDSLAALDVLLARGDVMPDRVGVYGVSLGGTFALQAAAQRPRVAAVAAVSAFSTWAGIASDHLPLLGRILMPGGLNARDAMPDIAPRPLLIVHGTQDTIVPVRHADILRDAASAAGVPVELVRIDGADHNAIIADHPEAERAIAEFFKRVLTAEKPDHTRP